MRRVWGPGGTGNKGEGALRQQPGVNTQGRQEIRGQDEPQGSRLSHGGRSIFLAPLGTPQPQRGLSVVRTGSGKYQVLRRWSTEPRQDRGRSNTSVSHVIRKAPRSHSGWAAAEQLWNKH